MNRRLRFGALLVVATFVAGACQVAGFGSPAHYDISADFPSTIGLYPGSFVRQLGIDIGSVAKVKNEGDHVLVTMKITRPNKLAANADAILVGDSVLGERYVQFEPAYTGGPTLPEGSELPVSRVTVPVETDTVLRSLNTVLRGIDPTDIRQFTVNLATVLDGQGAKLNSLIQNAAGTINLLANKSQDLGQLTTTLAQLTGQLGARDQALATLIKDYDLLSQTLAADKGQIDGVITQLTNVTTQATALLAPNLAPIQADVADLATVGQTLDRNIPAVDIGLQYAPQLFGAAKRAYDPQHNWLPLNSQSNASPTSAVLAGEIRDALASVCRRLAAKNPATAPALAACSNPASSFFNPILGMIPGVIGMLPGQAPTNPSGGARTASVASAGPPADAGQAFSRGLAAIPGLSAPQQQALLTGQRATASAPPPAPAGPPGAAAVATLEETPLATPPPPPVRRHHHRGFFGRVAHWVGGIL